MNVKQQYKLVIGLDYESRKIIAINETMSNVNQQQQTIQH